MRGIVIKEGQGRYGRRWSVLVGKSGAVVYEAEDGSLEDVCGHGTCPHKDAVRNHIAAQYPEMEECVELEKAHSIPGIREMISMYGVTFDEPAIHGNCVVVRAHRGTRSAISGKLFGDVPRIGFVSQKAAIHLAKVIAARQLLPMV